MPTESEVGEPLDNVWRRKHSIGRIKNVSFSTMNHSNPEFQCVKQWEKIDQEEASCDFFENPGPPDEETNESDHDVWREDISSRI